MKKQDREEILKEIIKDTLWMAIRYAHGRHTFAPDTVRKAVHQLRLLYQNQKMITDKDPTILPPTPQEVGGMSFRSDYLDDIFNLQDL